MKKFIFTIICSAFIFILPPSVNSAQAKQIIEQSSLATNSVKKKQKRKQKKKIKKNKKKGANKAKRKHKKAKKKAKREAKNKGKEIRDGE